uniref:Uncharacterized protein n=1 Tax=Rhizophora mucronata TaxID=61149 RepID=A0A2P2NHL5_RHIMU
MILKITYHVQQGKALKLRSQQSLQGKNERKKAFNNSCKYSCTTEAGLQTPNCVHTTQ